MDLNTLLKSQWDRVAAIGLTALGAVFLLVGWIGISGTAYLAQQAPYIVSGGIGGVFLLGVGATLWISADLRDEWRKLDRIEQALGDGTLRWADEGDQSAHPDASEQLWSGVNGAPRAARSPSSANVAATTAVSREAGVPAKPSAAAKPAATSRATRSRPRAAGVAHES